MFNKKFDKLVKDHPERFEYDFEAPGPRLTPEQKAIALPTYLQEALAAKRRAEKTKTGP